MSTKSTGKAIAGFFFGAALGVAAGLLFAPGSGVETRKKIQKKSDELSDEMLKGLDKKVDELKHFVGDLADETRAKIKKHQPESK